MRRKTFRFPEDLLDAVEEEFPYAPTESEAVRAALATAVDGHPDPGLSFETHLQLALEACPDPARRRRIKAAVADTEDGVDSQVATDGGERVPWCPDCEAFAVPTGEGECGACGASVEYRGGEEA
jgi:hypothetical protein